MRVILEFDGKAEDFERAFDAMDDGFNITDNIFYQLDYEPHKTGTHHTDFGDIRIIIEYENTNKRINLYDFIRMSEGDYDTFDTEYDAEVTVCINVEPEDDLDRFCVELCKKVDVVQLTGNVLIVNWSNYIKRNLNVFKTYAKEYWKDSYEDDESELIYQWIKELNLLMAGYGEYDKYGWYKEKLVDACK